MAKFSFCFPSIYSLKGRVVKRLKIVVLFLVYVQCFSQGLPLCYWQHGKFTNFGDELSYQLVKRIVGKSIRKYNKNTGMKEKKLLAIGSIISFADTGDVVWGSGIKKENLYEIKYKFTNLDVRAVRGPLSRQFLMKNFNIEVPEVYGDPALLIPYFFPEFQRNPEPRYDYIIIPHYSEQGLYPKVSKDEKYAVVYPTDPWDEVIAAICNSKLVISGSLHGIIIAEAYGIPARLLRQVTRQEPIFKYQDYYYGTGRYNFGIAFSITEALQMGGEVPIQCDLEALYNAFPFEFWPDVNFVKPDFTYVRK
jgi:pyruvyltransferase